MLYYLTNFRTPKTDSPISWLHRQDSALLLEHMSVLSKNPTYFTSDMDRALMASIHVKLIPRESVRLCEEIGEGAFGKVFKGRFYKQANLSFLYSTKFLVHS